MCSGQLCLSLLQLRHALAQLLFQLVGPLLRRIGGLLRGRQLGLELFLRLAQSRYFADRGASAIGLLLAELASESLQPLLKSFVARRLFLQRGFGPFRRGFGGGKLRSQVRLQTRLFRGVLIGFRFDLVDLNAVLAQLGFQFLIAPFRGRDALLFRGQFAIQLIGRQPQSRQFTFEFRAFGRFPFQGDLGFLGRGFGGVHLRLQLRFQTRLVLRVPVGIRFDAVHFCIILAQAVFQFFAALPGLGAGLLFALQLAA